MKLGQNGCLDEISNEFENGSCQVKNRVLHGSVVKCLPHNPGVLGSSHTGSSEFFHGSVLGQDTSEPQPTTGETQEDMINVSCHRDMTEILLKAV